MYVAFAMVPRRHFARTRQGFAMSETKRGFPASKLCRLRIPNSPGRRLEQAAEDHARVLAASAGVRSARGSQGPPRAIPCAKRSFGLSRGVHLMESGSEAHSADGRSCALNCIGEKPRPPGADCGRGRRGRSETASDMGIAAFDTAKTGILREITVLLF